MSCDSLLLWKHCLILTGMSLLSGTLFAQMPGNRDRSDKSLLLRRNDVAHELELVDDQVKAMKGVDAKFQRLHSDLRAKRSNMQDVTDPAERIAAGQHRLEETLSLLKQLQDAQSAMWNEVLLPHQHKRLDELCCQYQALDDRIDTFDRSVHLTDEQHSRLRAKEQDFRRELIAKLWDFHRRSQSEILDHLTPEQRLAWQKATGEEFKFETSSPGLALLRCIR